MELVKLKELRKMRGVSLKEMSKHIGVSAERLSLIERGKVNPSWETVVKFVEYLNLKLVIALP